MLPRRFDPTGSYRPLQIDRVSGYILLTHAEFEACLEDLALHSVNQAVDSWIATGRIRRPVLSVLACFPPRPRALPQKLDPRRQTARECVEAARAAFKKAVQANNGIKEHNVLRLMLPAGLLESEFDALWLSTISSFGKDRGDFAHRAARTVTQPDPQSTLNDVELILAGIQDLDRKLTAMP